MLRGVWPEELPMRSLRKILVAVKDPYARSHPAVAKAAQLARASGAQLELFHALTTPVYVDLVSQRGIEPFVDPAREHAARRLRALAAPLRRAGLHAAVAVDSDFPAYEAIIRHAGRVGADLIVADCHSGHRASWLLQLTDWELLRHSAVPVLLVKNRRPYRNPVVLAAIDPLHTFAKPGNLDAAILKSATGLKELMRGSLHAMHAYYPAPLGATPAEILNPAIATELQEKAEAKARKAFERVLRKYPVARGRRHLVPSHPFEAIEETARRTRADILVMGAISRSGLRRLFIGNTAERILDGVSCDVLVVKPKSFATHVPRARRGVRFASTPALYPH
jgi:universal stress protein E